MIWIDNKTIKIASEDGSEKVIDVFDNFKLIAHNEIPLFNKLPDKEWAKEGNHYHIYKSRSGTS